MFHNSNFKQCRRAPTKYCLTHFLFDPSRFRKRAGGENRTCKIFWRIKPLTKGHTLVQSLIIEHVYSLTKDMSNPESTMQYFLGSTLICKRTPLWLKKNAICISVRWFIQRALQCTAIALHLNMLFQVLLRCIHSRWQQKHHKRSSVFCINDFMMTGFVRGILTSLGWFNMLYSPKVQKVFLGKSYRQLQDCT